MAAEKTRGLFRSSFENLTRLLPCGSCRDRGTKVENRREEFTGDERNAAVSSDRKKKKKQGSGQAPREFELARMMKELNMMDGGGGGDLEQELDVEEALHYYSRLKSPVYVEIVDRFFMDMYDDFSSPPWPSPQLQQRPPALSKCRTTSRRRLRSIRC